MRSCVRLGLELRGCCCCRASVETARGRGSGCTVLHVLRGVGGWCVRCVVAALQQRCSSGSARSWVLQRPATEQCSTDERQTSHRHARGTRIYCPGWVTADNTRSFLCMNAVSARGLPAAVGDLSAQFCISGSTHAMTMEHSHWYSILMCSQALDWFSPGACGLLQSRERAG
jgi:hypothetical protein